MKTSSIALAFAAALAVSTSIVGTASAQSEEQKLNQVRRDNRDIRHDGRDIQTDKRDVAGDKKALANDRAARNYDLKREERAIEHGNLRGAEKWDQRRREEQREINAEKRDLRKDRRDLARDHQDRNEDIAKRNADASRL
jgi:hypothetical protein